ncbi:MAG: phenylacetate--CoA ligase family protein [Candidatus Hadarchaeum sp.]|uniref:phenylacetate--CoA ligase family protein n=1 Tax=Candidatus Hadarchaeum sp. TaxID=2883567 RepID=UPI003D0966F2
MNFLEEWIHSAIKQSLGESAASGNFPTGNRKIMREDIERYHLQKLSELVKYIAARSPFYRRLFAKADVNPGDIKSFEDFSKIPFTEPRNIIGKPHLFCCLPQSQIFRGFSAEGTLDSIRVFYTKDELDRIVASIAAALGTLGLRKGDVLQIMFSPEAEWGCDYLVSRAAEICGARAVVTGHGLLEEQVDKMVEHGTTMLIGSNPYIYAITGLAEGRGLDRLGIRSVILSRGCSYFPFDESIREEVERVWGGKAYDHYGTIETGLAVAIECPAQDGLHINEADFFIEVVDPETGEALEPGEEGELVFTTLNRRCMPLLRYRSGDISRLIKGRCGCGAEMLRMEGVKRKILRIGEE